MTQGIVLIVFGALIAIVGPIIGVTVTKGRASAKVTGGGAAVIGVMVLVYGIYLAATAGG